MKKVQKFSIKKFEQWLVRLGVEILPSTNEYEALRFKGKHVGVIYKTGKVNSPYTSHAIKCFQLKLDWKGGPVKTGRNKNYTKQKIQLLERDGSECFCCAKPLGNDISVEHLISLSQGGKNNLYNMVLCHESCNHALGTKPLFEKVRIAINNRLKK